MTVKNISSILLLLFCGFCGYYLFTKIEWQQEQQVEADSELPVFTADKIRTTSYSLDGFRNYTLTSAHLEHFKSSDETHFSKPLLHTFSQGVNQDWRVSADFAVLKDKHILEMNGNVNIYNLSSEAQLKIIKTKIATIDLTSRDFWTDSEITISGINFNSKGNRASGNFDSRTMKLIEKVKTIYGSQTN